MSDFADRIAKRNAQFFQRVNKTKRAVTFGVLSQVVLGTPVDKGRAISNWQVTTGRPSENVLDVKDKSGAFALREGNRVIGESKLEEDIWISNNLPYIYRLAYDGWSKKVSPGWFRNIIGNFRALINRAWGGGGGER